MKRVGKEPKLLPNVMEAIANLKEKTGSTQRKILDHVSHILKKNKDTSRNITVQIRRAIDHGIHSGLIKQRSGKYLLGLDNKDYAVFKRFRKVSDPLSAITEARRRRRRGRKGRRSRRHGRRRRRRGRRHAEVDDEFSDAASESEEDRSVIGTPEPMDRSRRRRRRRRGRKGRRRGRRRGRRHHAISSDHSDLAVSPSKKSSEDLKCKPEKRRSNDDNLSYQQKPSTQGGHNHATRDHHDRQPSRNQPRDSDINDCGNPECLCSIKQEEDQHDARYMSPDNNNDYYHDDYML